MERLIRLASQGDRSAAIELLKQASRSDDLGALFVVCEPLLHRTIVVETPETTYSSTVGGYRYCVTIPITERDEHTERVANTLRKIIDGWSGFQARTPEEGKTKSGVSDYLAWLTRLIPNPQTECAGCNSTGKMLSGNPCISCKGSGSFHSDRPARTHNLRMYVDALMLRDRWFERLNEAAGYPEGKGSPRVPLPVNLLPGDKWEAMIRSDGTIYCGEYTPTLPQTEYHKHEIDSFHLPCPIN